MDFVRKNVLILGCFGKSGIESLKLLSVLGANVYFYDENYNQLLSDAFKSVGAKSCFDFEITDDFLKRVFVCVVSPSVSGSDEIVIKLKQLGKPVISELELAFGICHSQVLAVTGTNGKSTTVSLLNEVISEKFKSFLVGNIGIPFSKRVLEMTKNDFACVEVSSYMLENILYFKPRIACVLNIEVDHLERHKTFSNYVLSKSKITSNQTADDFLVLNFDDEIVRKFASKSKAQKIFFSMKHKVSGAYILKNSFYYKGEKVCDLGSLKIKGEHNIQNALAVICFSKLLGIENEKIKNAFSKFNGLKHRMQIVDNDLGIEIINDSKATNVASCKVALSCLDKPTILMLGGYDKGESFDELPKYFGNIVKHIVVYGANSQKIISALKENGVASFTFKKGFYEAFEEAMKMSKYFECLLFSPASASFDEFNNFEERGEAFLKAVRDYV